MMADFACFLDGALIRKREERARLVGAREVSPDVYEIYLKRRGAIGGANSSAEIEKSVTFFEEAIRKDPTFAPAYVGLASAYDKLGLVLLERYRPVANEKNGSSGTGSGYSRCTGIRIHATLAAARCPGLNTGGLSS